MTLTLDQTMERLLDADPCGKPDHHTIQHTICCDCLRDALKLQLRDSVHGYDIIAQFGTKPDSVTRIGRVILVDKGPDRADGSSVYQRYVVAWQGWNRQTQDWDLEWGNGHYYVKLSDAALEYEAQVKRWGG